MQLDVDSLNEAQIDLLHFTSFSQFSNHITNNAIFSARNCFNYQPAVSYNIAVIGGAFEKCSKKIFNHISPKFKGVFNKVSHPKIGCTACPVVLWLCS